MKKVYNFELANIMGGVASPDIDCENLQYEANLNGHTFTKDQWDRWANAWETYCMN